MVLYRVLTLFSCSIFFLKTSYMVALVVNTISSTVFFNNLVICYACIKRHCQVYAGLMGG